MTAFVADNGAALPVQLPPCDVCGAPATAWRPGTAPDRLPDLFDAPLTAGDQGAAWRLAHHPQLGRRG